MEAPVWLSSEPLSKERHMKAKDYLAYIVNEIHMTIVATVDDEGLPVTVLSRFLRKFPYPYPNLQRP